MRNNDHTGAVGGRDCNAIENSANPFKNATESSNAKVNYPLTTGRKAQPYKNAVSCLSDSSSKQTFARKLFSPQAMGNHSGNLINNQILSAGKSGEKLMDRFIPCRMGENLQAKFEAVSSK
jgi:hypothetical protein